MLLPTTVEVILMNVAVNIFYLYEDLGWQNVIIILFLSGAPENSIDSNNVLSNSLWESKKGIY